MYDMSEHALKSYEVQSTQEELEFFKKNIFLVLAPFSFILFFFFNIYLFIYLAASGLSCGTQELRCGMWAL